VFSAINNSVMARFMRATHVWPTIGHNFFVTPKYLKAMGGPHEAGHDGSKVEFAS
jgi:hypothetical protein